MPLFRFIFPQEFSFNKNGKRTLGIQEMSPTKVLVTLPEYTRMKELPSAPFFFSNYSSRSLFDTRNYWDITFKFMYSKSAY